MMQRLIQTIVSLMVIWTLGSVIRDSLSGPPANAEPVQPASSYVTASGRPTSLSDFRGDFLWVDHAAAWCSYCAPQTRTIKALEQRYGDRVVFVTVVTGTDVVMQPPGADTALAWARRFGLDPERVLAHFSTDTLPYHVLYSPRGEVLFRDSGLYSQDRIIGVLRAKTSALDH